MSAPDHWVTLSLLGRKAGWTQRKLFGISFATASGHVILSVILGLIVVFVGLAVSTLISRYLSIGIGAVMIVAGLIFGVKPLVAKPETEETPEQEVNEEEAKLLKHERGGSGLKGIGYFAVLGAALSPDLSIVPVFLSAVPEGISGAIYLSIVFALASILTLIVLVQLGIRGLDKTFQRIPEKYNDSLVGFVIAAIGIYILVAG
jgi:nickel/cobalt exporter